MLTLCHKTFFASLTLLVAFSPLQWQLLERLETDTSRQSPCYKLTLTTVDNELLSCLDVLLNLVLKIEAIQYGYVIFILTTIWVLNQHIEELFSWNVMFTFRSVG